MFKSLWAHKSQDAIINTIHKEFNNASDAALAQAQQILDKVKITNIDKVKELQLMGFGQCQEVVEKKEKEEVIKSNKLTADIILRFRQNYPFNKFILPEDVVKICKKYNLVRGPLDRYLGFVPEKNLKEIKAFKPDIKDMEEQTTDMWTLWNRYRYSREHQQVAWECEWRSTHGYSDPISDLPLGWVEPEPKRYRHVPRVMSICAPISQMDTTGMKVNDKRELVKKDPVILYPVGLFVAPGSINSDVGYIIVTAWGKEASDSLVRTDV